jgi:pimeloyl-ACP methyl ester carboxylesterase
MDKASIKLANNETIHYIESGINHKDVLLLVHGNMSSSYHYLPIFHLLAEAYHVIAMDLRGFGDSTYHNPIESLEDYADDLKLIMEALMINKAHIAGWSTGGGIALKFAAKYPDLINKLVLIESASVKGYPIFKKDANFQPILTELYQSKDDMAKDPVQVVPALNAMQQNDLAFMKQIWLAAIYNQVVPEEIDFYLNETLKQRNLIDIDWALMTFNMTNEHNGVVQGDGSIANMNAETLVIYGLKDLVIPRYMYDETIQYIKHKTLQVYEEGSHSPITDFPNKLAERIKAFLK